MGFKKIQDSLHKMMIAEVGGYSLKKWLIIILVVNVVAMQWVHLNEQTLFQICSMDIGLVITLVYGNHQEKKLLSQSEKTKGISETKAEDNEPTV